VKRVRIKEKLKIIVFERGRTRCQKKESARKIQPKCMTRSDERDKDGGNGLPLIGSDTHIEGGLRRRNMKKKPGIVKR